MLWHHLTEYCWVPREYTLQALFAHHSGTGAAVLEYAPFIDAMVCTDAHRTRCIRNSYRRYRCSLPQFDGFAHSD